MHLLGVGARQGRAGCTAHIQPAHGFAHQVLTRGHRQLVESCGQLGADGVARGFHRLARRRLLAQLLGTLDTIGQRHLGGDAHAQELRPMCLARDHRLPQQQGLDAGVGRCQLGRHQRAKPDAQQADAAVAMLAQPIDAQRQVLSPQVPMRLFELTRAVTGAEHVQHQGADAQAGQGLGLDRHHRAATVHLLGKGRYHQDITARCHGRIGAAVEAHQRHAGAFEQHGAQGTQRAHGAFGCGRVHFTRVMEGMKPCRQARFAKRAEYRRAHAGWAALGVASVTAAPAKAARELAHQFNGRLAIIGTAAGGTGHRFVRIAVHTWPPGIAIGPPQRLVGTDRPNTQSERPADHLQRRQPHAGCHSRTGLDGCGGAHHGA